MRIRSYKHWTTNEDFKLIKLRNKGKKYKDIAIVMERTPLSVEKRYRKIKNEKIYAL
ncbi:Myb-like DNA-binding domain-containing protein [Metabacillus sp. YM-086]|nr:Myb-like DNA-binding domain-containing protein [Metabacillus litoralis]